jgi:hypothetical protein
MTNKSGFGHSLRPDDPAELNAGIIVLGEAFRMALLSGAISADIADATGPKYLDAVEAQVTEACQRTIAIEGLPIEDEAAAMDRIMLMIAGLISLARGNLGNYRIAVK